MACSGTCRPSSCSPPPARFSTYLGRWFFYESVVRFGPAKASIFQISSPLFTAMMAWLLLGERLTLLVALGMVMTIAGLMLVSCKPDFFSRRSSPVAAMAPDGEPAPAVVKTGPRCSA
jgi:drug/metabolite transporter (DMT)-like permease